MESKNVYYYGRGCVIAADGKYAKYSDYEYWIGCKEYFDEVNLILFESQYLKTSSEYSAPLRDFPGKVATYEVDGLLTKIHSIARIVVDIFCSPRHSIHFFYFPNSLNIVLYCVALMLGRRTVSYWGNDWSKVGDLLGRQRGGKYRWMRLVYRFAQRLIVKSSGLTIFAGKALYDEQKKYTSYAIETKPFINIGMEDIFVREDTCTDNIVRILYVGTFTERKGVLDLVDICELLDIEGKEIRFILVGAGKLEKQILKKIQVRGLEDSVKLAGYVGKKETLLMHYRNCDLFFLPSYMEGFPRVLYEAMSQSIPIVSTNVGSIPMLMRDGENALLSEPGDKDSIIKNIRVIVGNSELRREMIVKNRLLFVQMIMEKPAVQHSKKMLEVFGAK